MGPMHIVEDRLEAVAVERMLARRLQKAHTRPEADGALIPLPPAEERPHARGDDGTADVVDEGGGRRQVQRRLDAVCGERAAQRGRDGLDRAGHQEQRGPHAGHGKQRADHLRPDAESGIDEEIGADGHHVASEEHEDVEEADEEAEGRRQKYRGRQHHGAGEARTLR